MRADRRTWPPFVWPLAGLLLLLLVNALTNPGFLRITIYDGHLFGGPIDILNQGSRTLLLSLGMSLVIATGGIDLSVGSVMAVSGALAANLLIDGASMPTAFGVALGVALVIGLVNGGLVAWLGVQPIVATLILMVAGRGISQLITRGEVLLVRREGFDFLGNGYLAGLPFSILLVSAIYGVTHLFLRRTAAGLFVEATGDGEIASRFAGLAAGRVKALTYVFCGGCAGLAGLLAASNIRAADAYQAGINMELDAIFAVVVGGTALTGGRFFLLGSFFGALLLQTLSATMYNVGVPPAIAPMPKALVILAVCLVQSEKTRRWFAGLLERRATA